MTACCYSATVTRKLSWTAVFWNNRFLLFKKFANCLKKAVYFQTLLHRWFAGFATLFGAVGPVCCVFPLM
jgi:hypothetical protein